jgi:uncharacterized OsmC-like protein
MDRDTLRAAQRPLKAQYRETPDAAVITLQARGSLGEGVTCSVDTGRAMAVAGLHPATGGPGTNVCSGDLLLQALVACAGVTLQAVAANREIPVSGTVRAEGDLDVRGTLGVDPDAPVGFRAIRLVFELASEASPEQLAELVTTTERYCVVLQTLLSTPAIDLSVESADGWAEFTKG